MGTARAGDEEAPSTAVPELTAAMDITKRLEVENSLERAGQSEQDKSTIQGQWRRESDEISRSHNRQLRHNRKTETSGAHPSQPSGGRWIVTLSAGVDGQRLQRRKCHMDQCCQYRSVVTVDRRDEKSALPLARPFRCSSLWLAFERRTGIRRLECALPLENVDCF